MKEGLSIDYFSMIRDIIRQAEEAFLEGRLQTAIKTAETVANDARELIVELRLKEIQQKKEGK